MCSGLLCPLSVLPKGAGLGGCCCLPLTLSFGDGSLGNIWLHSSPLKESRRDVTLHMLDAEPGHLVLPSIKGGSLPTSCISFPGLLSKTSTNLGGLKQQKFILSQFWRPLSPKSRCQQGHVLPPSQGSRGGSFLILPASGGSRYFLACGRITLFFSFINLFIYFYFWLCWVFVSV